MTIATNGVFSPLGRKCVNSTYIVATSNDTTASGNGPTIDNRDGLLERIGFGVVCTAGTGTSPTVTATLKGSIDGTNWFNVLDSGGNAIATGAVTAAETNTEFEDTNQEGITKFPPFVRISYAVGGLSTPGWTGSIQVDLQRAA